jgi:hypothetical protein
MTRQRGLLPVKQSCQGVCICILAQNLTPSTSNQQSAAQSAKSERKALSGAVPTHSQGFIVRRESSAGENGQESRAGRTGGGETFRRRRRPSAADSSRDRRQSIQHRPRCPDRGAHFQNLEEPAAVVVDRVAGARTRTAQAAKGLHSRGDARVHGLERRWPHPHRCQWESFRRHQRKEILRSWYDMLSFFAIDRVTPELAFS